MPKVTISNTDELNRNIIIGKTVEDEFIEFKREPNYKKENSSEEMALDFCQFANTLGGVVLYGVEEKYDNETNKKIASKYSNIDFERLSKFINDKVIPLINPKSIRISYYQIKVSEDIFITSVNIEAISNTIACVQLNKPPYSQKYPYRTNYGKKYLTALEVEKMISMNNRHNFIKLKEIFQDHNKVTLYPGLIKETGRSTTWDNGDDTVVLKDIGENEFTLNASGLDINIPFSLAKDIWRTERETIGIILNTRIIISSCRRKIFFDIN